MSKTKIKTYDQKKRAYVIKLISIITVSLIIGIALELFTSGQSYIDDAGNIISILMIFFGFSITSFTFIFQSFLTKEEESERKQKMRMLINSLAKSIKLVLGLIIGVLLINCFASLTFVQRHAPQFISGAIIKTIFFFAIVNVCDIINCLIILVRHTSSKV